MNKVEQLEKIEALLERFILLNTVKPNDADRVMEYHGRLEMLMQYSKTLGAMKSFLAMTAAGLMSADDLIKRLEEG